jgi:glycosyltransferase involved in cell wall biosynthesis
MVARVVTQPRRMRAYVDLAAHLDAENWHRRHVRDEVPDASPYGLHRLEDYGVDVTFRRPSGSGRAGARVARSVIYRTDGLELVEGLTDLPASRRAAADAVLAYDERTSIPAALLHNAHLRPPVIAGVGWLTTREQTHPVLARLAARALPRAARVWTQSAPVAPLLSSEWGVPASRVRLVPVGIDTDFYPVQPPPERPDVIASAGEDRFRDHDLLIRAVLAVRRHRPSVSLELATGLPVAMPDDLGVRHTERMDGRMRGVYQRASVIAVALRPSITGSGLSVMLEAMSSGRALVATANPGIDEYVRDGVTGVLVPSGDEPALARAIEDLLADPDRAAELARNAAHDVRQRFTSAVMARELAAMVTAL